jgi:hypothetical protein
MVRPLKRNLNKTLTEVGYAGLVTRCAPGDVSGALRTKVADKVPTVELERPLVRQHPLRQNIAAKWPTRVSGFHPAGSVRQLRPLGRLFESCARANFCQTNETGSVLESVRKLRDNLR